MASRPPSEAAELRLREPAPLRRGEVALARLDDAQPAATERLNAVLGGRSIHLQVSPPLLDACGGAEALLKVIQETFRKLPDRDRVAAALPKDDAASELALLDLDGAPTLCVEDARSVGVVTAALSTPPRARMWAVVAILRGLRRRLEGPLGGATTKRDVGAALLALGTDTEARDAVSAASIQAAAGPLLAEDDSFLALLTQVLAQTPLRQPLPTAADNIYLDPVRFDALPRGEQLKVVIAGQLAWLTTASFGLLYLFRGLWERWPGRYGEARRALTRGIEGGIFKRRMRQRVLPAARRGQILRALELFWSGWNPTLTRVTIRPVYRMLGGNARPFTATLLTFLFSGCVVHLMGLTSLLLVVCYALRESSPFAAWLSQPAFISVQVGAWAVYMSLGLMLGAVKALRLRS